MKKTLKQKIALGLISASGLAAVCGVSLIIASSNQKWRAIDAYSKSDDFKTTIAQELSEAEIKFNSQEFSLDALTEYHDKVNEIYSLSHKEEMIKKDNGAHGKAYVKSQDTFSAGTLTLMGAAAGFITGCLSAIELISPKSKKDEEKTIAE